jgi:hypothetical protein
MLEKGWSNLDVDETIQAERDRYRRVSNARGVSA